MIKKSTEEFKKLFPDTAEGFAKMTDGFWYTEYSKNYVYHCKEHVNSVREYLGLEPAFKLVYPEGSDPDLDEQLNVFTNNLISQLASRETSGYHGKVVLLEDAKKLVSLKEDINIPNLPETIIPYKRARDLVLQSPDAICVIDCPCRQTKENPCLPLDVCMMIGEPIVSFVMDHNKDNPRRITQQEALDILEAEHKRGHVHTAYFKDAMGDRFYCLCNCCKCCCTSMNAYFLTIPMMCPSGYISVRTEDCIGCGTCNEACHFSALSIVDGKTMVNEEKCMGCGICQSKCEQGAISLILDKRKGEPFDVEKIMADHQS